MRAAGRWGKPHGRARARARARKDTAAASNFVYGVPRANASNSEGQGRRPQIGCWAPALRGMGQTQIKIKIKD